jgi:Ca-activated chloride channel family protein
MMIDGMRDGDRFGLVSYSDQATVNFPMDEVELNRSQMRDIIGDLEAVGGTNLYDGLELGYQEAQEQYETGRQNRVIVLSDGQPTVGLTDDDSILTMSKAYNSDGIGLTSIGLGTSFNANLMRNLALQADGNFYFLEDSGAVSEVFTEELSYFTVPVALNLELTLAAGEAYDFGAAHGTPFWQDTETGGSLSVPSVFLAHRESADDITEDGGRRGGGSALLIELMPKRADDDGSGATDADVAVIDIEFDDPIEGVRVSDQVVVNYPNAPWVLEPTGFFRSDDIEVVQKSFVMLNLYVGIEQACSMYHEFGETRENVDMLRRLLAAVRDYNEEIEDPDIEFDIELVEGLVSVLETLGQPQPEPDDIPTDPWPAD